MGTPDDEALSWGGRDKARDEVLDMVARGLRRIGVRPNHLTLAQIPVYAFMIHAGIHQELYRFAVLQLFVMALDGLDGTLARRMGIQSRSGAYLDAAFDLFGIVLIMLVAIYIHPEYSILLVLLLVASLLLYLQNYVLDEKAVSYVRGPLVIALIGENYWPGIMNLAIMVPLLVTVLIIIVRGSRTPTPPEQDAPPGPPPYKPGFSAPPKRRTQR